MSNTKPATDQLAIEQVPIGDIKPYWRNPRDNDRAVPAVRASIEAYGFQQPLVIDMKGIIIAGHTRYRAALELDYTKLPCIRTTLNPEQAKKYRIADNKTAEFAEWNLNALIQELNDFGDTMSDLEPFFGKGDLADLMGSGSSFTPITQEDVLQSQGDLDVHFTVNDDAKKAAMVELICPHCAKPYALDRNQLLNQQTT